MEQSGGKVNFRYLILSGLSGVFGLVAFLYFLFTGISGLTDELIPADMPGTLEIRLNEPGSYTVFHEWTHPYPADVVVGGDEDAKDMLLTLTNSQGGEVALTSSAANSNYQMGSRQGYSLYSFEIAEAGTYTLTGRYQDGSEARVMYTLANNFMGKILRIVLICFGCVILPGFPSVLFLVLALKPLMGKQGQH
jgi:hypothetical protein